MMNLLALGLVLTSLVTGSIWSPSPPPRHDDHSKVIVKEGHRVVVVEYEKEGDGNTKVFISPHEEIPDDAGGGGGKSGGVRELVCDAFGKCKYTISNAIGKTKDKVSEAVHGASDKAHNIEETLKDRVHGYQEQAKESVSEAIEKSKEKIEGVEEKAKTTTIGESLGKAKGSVAQGIGKAKKVAGDVMSTVKDGADKAKDFDVLDSPKRIGEDIQRNVTGRVEEGASHVMNQAKENVEKVGKKSLGEILSKLRDATYDVIWYVVSPEKVDAVVGLVHMLGFSTAYGMCVWVTFVSSYILGRYLPRQQFGMVQSRIYPVYFRAMCYCMGAAFLGQVLGQRKQILSSLMEMFQGFSLFSALLMVLTNMIWLEPRATKVMFERVKIEKEEGRGLAGAAKEGIADDGSATVMRPAANVVAERQDVVRLNEKLKRLNTYSSALNVSTLVVLTWHMAYLGQRLQATR